MHLACETLALLACEVNIPIPYLTPLAQYGVLFPSNIQTLGHKAVLSLNDAMPLNFRADMLLILHLSMVMYHYEDLCM